jgi:hypothetical protein
MGEYVGRLEGKMTAIFEEIMKRIYQNAIIFPLSLFKSAMTIK